MVQARFFFGSRYEKGDRAKSVMEMRDRGDVPGVTGQGACQKSAFVIDEMGDDNFNDF